MHGHAQCVLQFHQVLSKSDEKQKRFIPSPFFCSEFQSVSRIVKIVHSANGTILRFYVQRLPNLILQRKLDFAEENRNFSKGFPRFGRTIEFSPKKVSML